jgi:hypothetical protein
MKPTFKVLYEDFNKNDIQFVNWFEFGQWSVIKKELNTLKKKLRKFEKDDFEKIQPEIKKFFEKHVCSVGYKKCKSLDDLIEYALEERLKRLCMYYFWAKCEYEVIVSSWPPREKSEKKIDIYAQLEANWPIFKDLVFREIYKK